MENLQSTIANNLIYLRKKNNLTQQELALKINYSDNAVSRWERGDATPTIEILAIIADYYGIKVSDIIDEHFQDKNQPKDPTSLLKRIFVILFSVSIVWTFALIGFSYTQMFKESMGIWGDNGWLLFIVAVPLSMIVLYFYNKMWGNRIYHLIILSVFWWSLLTVIYLLTLQLSDLNLWLIFLLGVPIQLAQLLWYLVRK